MPREFALRLPRAANVERIPQEWRAPLAQLAAAWAVLIVLFIGDWADMAAQWWDSSTYNHILLVPPIIGYLVWLRAGELAKLRPQAWWPGLVWFAGGMFAWLLGSVSGLNFASQLGAVTVLQGAVLAILGPRVALGLLFPLCFAFFLVPFGDELVPTLQMVTAAIVIWLTGLSGIPAEISGVFIDTPAGLFEVAEACSGVKFLIAMIALGSLVAHVCFRTWHRRAAFMAMAVAIPILANGVRAWGTIFVAQSQGLEFAEGFDHIFYGWVFFAIVLAALLGMGWRWFERWPEDPYIHAGRIVQARLPLTGLAFHAPRKTILAVMAVLATATLAWSHIGTSRAAEVPEEISLPDIPGWTPVDYEPDVWWEPRASGAEHRLLGRYRSAQGELVDVFFATYSSQGEGQEAGSFGEGALVPDTPWRWSRAGDAQEGGKGEWLQAYTENHRYAVTWYRTGDVVTGSNARLKIANMLQRLTLKAEPTMTLILSTEQPQPEQAHAAIARFREASGPLGEWMDAVAQKP